MSESDTEFFERLSGNRVTLIHDRQGKLTGFTAHGDGEADQYAKVSDLPPKAAEPRRPRVAITLDRERLDAFVGRYEFAPTPVFPAGMQAKVWREEDQLLWQESGENAIPGAIELYPETGSSFFTKLDATRLVFHRDSDGQATAVVLHPEDAQDLAGKKIAAD